MIHSIWTPYTHPGTRVNVPLFSLPQLSSLCFPGEWCPGAEPGLGLTHVKGQETSILPLFSCEIYLLPSPQAQKALTSQYLSPGNKAFKQPFARSDQQVTFVTAPSSHSIQQLVVFQHHLLSDPRSVLAYCAEGCPVVSSAHPFIKSNLSKKNLQSTVECFS